MKKIQLSGQLDESESWHSVGRGVFAENDGSLEIGRWDLCMVTAENHIGTDYGEGVDVEMLSVEEFGDEAWCMVALHDHDALRNEDCSFHIAFAIDSRYLVEEDDDD